MKKTIYNIYIMILKFILKSSWVIDLSKKQTSSSILLFADGTFESNALMLVPVANQLTEENFNTTFAFEYGASKGKGLKLQNSLNPAIHQLSIKKSWLVNHFSLYNTSSLKQKIGFFTYPIVLLNLILKTKPKYLLVANDIMFPSKMLVKLCKHLNIPTLSLQHGALCSPFFPIEADKLGVYSEGVKKFIVQNNLAEKEQIVSVGNPRWDFLTDYVKQKEIQTKHSILILSQSIVYKDPTGIIDKNIDALFELVKQLADRYPDINIIIKLHPLENSELWREKISFALYPNLSISDLDLITLLKQTTICISGATTAFMEAALFGLKCLAFRPFESTIAVPKKTEMDHFLNVYDDMQKLLLDLDELLQNHETIFNTNHDMILDHFGQSSKFIAQYIEKEIKNNEKRI